MLKIIKIVILGTILLLSCSCAKSKDSENKVDSSKLDSNCITRYDVYEYNVRQQNIFAELDEFSVVMINNPIDKKMYEDLKIVDTSSTGASQVFFSEYVKVWQDELAFSIDNLKNYLSPDDLEKLEIAQSNWEQSWETNGEFDHSLMANRKIGLGTQYVTSGLLYLIDQYRVRVGHIKYMTYLSENYVENATPQKEQLWNKFHGL